MAAPFFLGVSVISCHWDIGQGVGEADIICFVCFFFKSKDSIWNVSPNDVHSKKDSALPCVHVQIFYRLHVSDIMHQEFFWNANPLAIQKNYVPLIPVDLGGESSCR